jgi:SAM-dependent methyltransferase
MEWYEIAPDGCRVYNALLGGRDNYAEDRELVRQLLDEVPWLPAAVRINRVHGALTTACLSRLGFSQFLDLGCGYPSWEPDMPDVHEAATAIHPGARVVYVDSNKGVVTHGKALFRSLGTWTCFQGDITDMGRLLAAPAIQEFDLDRPIAVLSHDVLPYIADDDTVDQALATLRAWLPPGSALSITHATADLSPAAMDTVTALYRQARIAYRPRSRDHIRGLFAGWPQLGPGVVATGRWHTDHLHALRTPHVSGAYAGIAVKPLNAPPGAAT